MTECYFSLLDAKKIVEWQPLTYMSGVLLRDACQEIIRLTEQYELERKRAKESADGVWTAHQAWKDMVQERDAKIAHLNAELEKYRHRAIKEFERLIQALVKSQKENDLNYKDARRMQGKFIRADSYLREIANKASMKSSDWCRRQALEGLDYEKIQD